MNDPPSKTSLPPRASLLGLPTEISLQILGYLLPDMAVVPHPMRWEDMGDVHMLSPLRKDYNASVFHYKHDNEYEPLYGNQALHAELLQHFKTVEEVMCSNRDPAEQQPMIELFLQYLRKYNAVWRKYQISDYDYNEAAEFGYEPEDDLLDQAWQACERGDLEAFQEIQYEREARGEIAEEEYELRQLEDR